MNVTVLAVYFLKAQVKYVVIFTHTRIIYMLAEMSKELLQLYDGADFFTFHYSVVGICNENHKLSHSLFDR